MRRQWLELLQNIQKSREKCADKGDIIATLGQYACLVQVIMVRLVDDGHGVHKKQPARWIRNLIEDHTSFIWLSLETYTTTRVLTRSAADVQSVAVH